MFYMIVIMECTAVLAYREGCDFIVNECHNEDNVRKGVGDSKYLLITKANEQPKSKSEG